MIRIIESPREAMQGIKTIIPAEKKIAFINDILKVGFDLVETGSIVSPKRIPQMADSLEVLEKLDISTARSKLMFLVVNKKGAEIISGNEKISALSYPFSVSPAFAKLNLNATMEQTLEVVDSIWELCLKRNKEFILYLSMAFGNPYGDPWSLDLLCQWLERFSDMGIKTIPLSNVVVPIDEQMISKVFSTVIPGFPSLETGLHLHTTFEGWYGKVNAAYLAGCRRFDTVMNGLGGCPESGEDLLGNLDTVNFYEFLKEKGIETSVESEALTEASRHAAKLFSEYPD
jgi:hydroxymethylglutaryl-CoA lyase